MESVLKTIGPNDRDAALAADAPVRPPSRSTRCRPRARAAPSPCLPEGRRASVYTETTRPSFTRFSPPLCVPIQIVPSRPSSTVLARSLDRPSSLDSVEKLRSVSLVTPPPFVPIQRLPSRSPVSDATELWFSPSLAVNRSNPRAAAPAHAAVGADPEAAFGVFIERRHGIVREPVAGRVGLERPAAALHQTFGGADPQRTVAVLPQCVDAIVRQTIAGGVGDQAIAGHPRQPAVGSDPDAAVAGLCDRPDEVVRQAVARGEGRRLAVLEAQQSAAERAEPEVAGSIAGHRGNPVVRESVARANTP